MVSSAISVGISGFVSAEVSIFGSYGVLLDTNLANVYSLANDCFINPLKAATLNHVTGQGT